MSWSFLSRVVPCAVAVAISCAAFPMGVQAQNQPYVTHANAEHLLFPYWSTENATNTNIHLHAPAGVMNETDDEAKVVVKVAVRDPMNKMVASLKICLTPADSWTATLSEQGLVVGDPGNCDEQVELEAAGRGAVAQRTPKPGQAVSLGAARSGWLEAWIAPTKGLKDGTDTGTDPDNAAAALLAPGKAALVSAGSGFSSSYTTVSLIGCGPGTNTPGPIMQTEDDGDGCWTTHNNGSNKKENGEAIRLALADAGHNADFSADTKVAQIGEWTALDDANVQTRTKLVLTLPMNHLAYMGTNAGGDKVEGTDPVSLLVFDEEGEVEWQAREVLLAKNVNTCMFLPAALAQEMEMEVGAGKKTVLSCNGAKVGELAISSGTFRLFNNTVDVKSDAGVVTNTGAEATGLGRAFPPGTDATKNGQSIAESLGVIGLNFSYFKGTDEQEYDQVTPLSQHAPGSAAQL